MHNPVDNIKIEPHHITSLPGVGAGKSQRIIELAPTLGKLLQYESAVLADQVRGLSEVVATHVLNWARVEHDALTKDQVEVVDDGTFGGEEDVLPGEERGDAFDPAEGPVYEDLAVTDVSGPRVKLKIILPPPKGVTEFRTQFDKTLVVRKA